MGKEKPTDSLIDVVDIGVVLLDAEQRISGWNLWIASRLGYAGDLLKNKTLAQVFPETSLSELQPMIDDIYQMACGLDSECEETSSAKGEFADIQRQLESWHLVVPDSADPLQVNRFTFRLLLKPYRSAKGEHGCLLQFSDLPLLGGGEDVASIIENEHRMRTIFESARDGIITFELNGKIASFNKAAAKLFGYSDLGLGDMSIFKIIDELSALRHQKDLDVIFSNWEIEFNNIELTGIKSCGTTFPVEFSISQIDNQRDDLYVGVFHDVSERKHTEEKLERLAHFDPMTQLPNRSLFRDRLNQAIRRSNRSKKSFILMYIDLDRFKVINDTLGHEIGDALLQQVSERLRLCVREVDTVARIGGDEFTAILEDVSDETSAAIVAQKIMTAINQGYQINTHEVYVTSSIGVAIYPMAGETVSELLKHADVAMSDSKAKGRNTFSYYTDELIEASSARMEIEKGLRTALVNKEFYLVFQPLINLEHGNVFGAEALIRWEHPERGFVPPDQFIPIAEETGSMLDIGRWVFYTACTFCRKVLDSGKDSFQIAINISPRQFADTGFYDFVHHVLNEVGITAHSIELEITEGLLMEDVEANIKLLNRLSDDGFRISMDDFGTGYSSLSYINRFPLNTIKIDRSFVQGLPETLDSLSITKAILYMAKGLGLDVVAEGVETESQKNFLRDELCDLAQGYLISRPLNDNDFLEWLAHYVK